jgi:hypothetical protein
MMILQSNKSDLNLTLQSIANKLDIDLTRYKKAVTSYKAVGNWLKAESSPLHQYDPIIYPQGSFLLGTVVKPIDNDYDLDFVCELKKGHRLNSQETFRMIGDRLKEHATFSKMLQSPKNRCWRLIYAGDFHMDIIPAIPDLERGDTAILLPDRELSDWTKSDPKGYGKWFKGRMKDKYDLHHTELAIKELKEVEEIHDYLVKAQLQQSIQLMKRHRDIYFQDKREKDKPISIIITTLAGYVYEAYGVQEDLFQTLNLLSKNMVQVINSNSPKVPNPTNYEEDFADKWNEKPEREQAFHEWIRRLQTDLDELQGCSSLSGYQEKLQEMFGERVELDSRKESNRLAPVKPAEKSIFDVPHRKSVQWPYKPSCEVNIKAIKKSGITKGVMPGEFHNNSHLQKGYSLEFIAKTKASGNFQVQWQVVNTGYEAEIHNQLRGEFYQSDGKNSDGHYKIEKTRYSGSHWVEAFVIKDDVCIARSGEFVINIK